MRKGKEFHVRDRRTRSLARGERDETMLGKMWIVIGALTALVAARPPRGARGAAR
ncbi:MAG: hypothetical protein ACREKI_07830 [Gemmatimonadota bacterium]